MTGRDRLIYRQAVGKNRTSEPTAGEPGPASSRRLRTALIAPLALLTIAAAPAERGQVRYVTDGDTFRLTSGERIRIAGIDAPETHADKAKCRAEIALGKTASARVRTLLDHQQVRFVRVGRSYNRTVAKVTLSGRDLATQLVELGVARWWPRGQAKPDWCGGSGRRGRRAA